MLHLSEKVEGIRCGGEGKEEMREVDQPGEVEGEGGRFNLGEVQESVLLMKVEEI